ncbi:MAG: ABC transporter permease, partial [Verrucomicrobia bacterium]|nr:ABC transporter permease [Verrucomicrobiota bacterium]
MRWFQTYLRSSEGVILLTMVLLCTVVTFINPIFVSAPNLLDLVRDSITTGLFALGVYLALLSGGLDVSFTAVGVFSMYATVKYFSQSNPQAPLALIFFSAALLGGLLGTFNAILIAFFRLPTLIVTLGTLNLFRGILLTFVGTKHITDIPDSMLQLSRTFLYRGKLADGSLFSLPATTLALVVVAILVAVLVRYTMLGRSIYAIGGSEVASERLGIPVARVRFFVYVAIGIIAGIAGIVHGSQIRVANPFDLVGTELNVLAAVVLGGARITGGRGSVFGTLMGVFLVTIINNSLILLGVSSYYDR